MTGAEPARDRDPAAEVPGPTAERSGAARDDRTADTVPAGRRGLRHRVRAGEKLLGTFSVIPSTEVVELIALAGFDFVILDMEHGPYTLDLVHQALLAAAAHQLPAVVRVPDNSAVAIGSVLDLGADGVLVPQVGSAATTRAVVAAARFAPHGSRGSNPWVRAARFTGDPEWLARSNEETLVMVMVEGVEAIRSIDDIMVVDGLDAIFLGPVDTSHALGLPGQPDHPLVLETLTAVAATARSVGMATAVFAPAPPRARDWWNRGLGLVACAVDSRMILDGLSEVRRAAHP
ncbi:aldolase/citrate lyase family protein [Micromonospora sp. FIMYZ51]|uniref:HpcH/HpaI aldolase family protein n=1 Tax=Micromonospora sp. FIMYZ51 TaxID=3051832 RepID=UPI00311D88A1